MQIIVVFEKNPNFSKLAMKWPIWQPCVTISDRRVVLQYRSFVIMFGGADATHPT